jgi:hypothetical protein
MQSVSRFEANLLRLLYYFLRREPPERALPLIEARLPPPPCLSRPAVNLVRDALAKGCTHLLAQRGGWRSERHLRGAPSGRQPPAAGRDGVWVAEGRLWERTAPADLGLSFSAHALGFLVWITAARPGDKEPAWGPPAGDLTPGDLLLLFFAHEGLRHTADGLGAPSLRTRPPFAEHGLCWLAYPEDYAAAGEEFGPDFGPWTAGLGACMLEALQPVLAARWIVVEGSKERIADPQLMRALGRSQERVLTAFLDAVEKAGRLDLARFLLAAAGNLLGPHAHAGMWTGRLHLTGLRVADRVATYQGAAVFLRVMDRLQTWERQARGVGYWDEGYAASQLWKAGWEHYLGDVLHGRAQAIVRQMDPMRQAGPAAQQA